jgi:hypothetical protein
MKLGKWLLSGVVAASALLMAGAASAKLTVLGTEPNDASGPYSNHFFLFAPGVVTDYVSFQITSNQLVYGTVASLTNGLDRDIPIGPGTLTIFGTGAIDTCSGVTCTGGTLQSTGGAATNPVVLTPGFYYEVISAAAPAGPSGYFGAIFAQGVGGIPEPAGWMMMILGFGMLGAGLRMRNDRRGLSAI